MKAKRGPTRSDQEEAERTESWRGRGLVGESLRGDPRGWPQGAMFLLVRQGGG
jgi:hypothetical protein